jgi:hypothetical protein
VLRITPQGELRVRMARSRERLLSDDPYSVPWVTSDVTQVAGQRAPGEPRWTMDWWGDVSGRWLGAMSALAPTFGSHPKLEEVAGIILRHQHADGHFGGEQALSKLNWWQMSGTAFLLRGLLERHGAFDDAAALEAAMRLGEYYLKTAPYWLSPEGMVDSAPSPAISVFSNYTHCLDGLVLLSKAAGDDRFLALAQEIAQHVKPYQRAIHSHHFLSTLRGLMDLHAATGDADALARVQDAWECIRAFSMIPTGGVYEYLPSSDLDEGCSEVDWAILNLQLWQATRDPVYIDLAERVILNHLFYAQWHNGGFGHCRTTPCELRRGFTGREPPDPGAVEAFWCCSMHGGFGLAKIADLCWGVDGEDLWADLPFACDVEARLPSGDVVRISHTSDACEPDRRELVIGLERPARFTLRLRVPTWAGEIEVLLNGDEFYDWDEEHGCAVVNRRWDDRDHVQVNHQVPLLVEAWQEQFGAIARGPFVLCADDVLNPGLADQPDPWRAPWDSTLLAPEVELDRPDPAAQFVDPRAQLRVRANGLRLRPVGGHTWNDRPAYCRVLFRLT